MKKKVKFKNVLYDLESLGTIEREIMKKEIAEQFPEPKKEQIKEVKKYKTSDE